MEPVLFYGVPSGCSLASIIALEWLGQPYKLSRIEMLDTWPAEFAKLNPRMKTPALLRDDGAALTESLAILQHIGSRGIDAGLGFRQGTLEFDRLAEMLSYLSTDFFSSFAPLWKLYETEGVSEQDKARIRAEGAAAVKHEFAIVERMLEGRDWLLGGDKPTVADAYLFAVGRWADYHRVFDMEAAYPAVYRHTARMRAMPEVKFALAVEQDKAAQSGPGYRGHVAIDELLSARA
jgi:glutathione S-transferase